jgi:hypothetical protein
MRTWQVERRKRTRHLIELGGLVVKAGVVDLTGDDRAMILGALLWMADKLKSNEGEQARALWAAKGKEAFAVDRVTNAPTVSQDTPRARRFGGHREGVQRYSVDLRHDQFAGAAHPARDIDGKLR